MTVQKVPTKLQSLITILLLIGINMAPVNIAATAITQEGITFRFAPHANPKFAFFTRILNTHYSHDDEFDSIFVDENDKKNLKDNALNLLDNLLVDWVKQNSDHDASPANSHIIKQMKRLLKHARWIKSGRNTTDLA